MTFGVTFGVAFGVGLPPPSSNEETLVTRIFDGRSAEGFRKEFWSAGTP